MLLSACVRVSVCVCLWLYLSLSMCGFLTFTCLLKRTWFNLLKFVIQKSKMPSDHDGVNICEIHFKMRYYHLMTLACIDSFSTILPFLLEMDSCCDIFSSCYNLCHQNELPRITLSHFHIAVLRVPDLFNIQCFE